MALLADKSADVGSNLVQGRNAQSLTFTMPGGVALKVLSVVATINNASAVAVTPELTIKEQSGAVIATKRQGSTIPAGDTGTATFALRLNADGSTAGTGGLQFDTSPQTGNWLLITTTGSNAATSNYGMKFSNTSGMLAVSSKVIGVTTFSSILDSSPGFFQINATTDTTGFEANIEASSSTYLRIRETNTFGGEFIGMSVGTLTLEAFDNAGADAMLQLNVLHGAVLTLVGPGMGFKVKDGAQFPFQVFNDGVSGNNRVEVSIDTTVGWFKITNHTRTMVTVDGAGNVTARLPTGGKLEVQDNAGNPIFRVDEDGDLHGLTGKALVFDL